MTMMVLEQCKEVFKMGAAILSSPWAVPKKEKKEKTRKNKGGISAEDQQILSLLNQTARELWFAQENFEMAENDMLVDSFSYEILALNRRYDYYITLCKARGLVANSAVKRR
jgi:valyl-tRNA synthetase